MVGLGLQELINEIPIGSVQFDTFEATGFGPSRSLTIVLYNAGNLFRIQGARDLMVVLACGRVNAIGVDLVGRCGDGKLSAMETGMGSPSSMPELCKNLAAFAMDCLYNRLLRLGLCIVIETGGVEPTIALFRYDCRFRDD